MTPLSPPISTIPSSLQHPNSNQPNLSRHSNLFNQLSDSNHKPNEFTLASLLKASSALSDPNLGLQLHARSIRAGLASHFGVRTSLIAMYSASGHLDSSRKVFDESPSSDAPLWNSIMSAYNAHGQHTDSLRLLSAMVGVEHLTPTVATYVIMIRACAARQEISLGRALHARMVKESVADDTKLLNSLVTLYSKCGALREAREAFDATDGTSVVSWNAMIAGYEQNGECEQALRLFSRLTRERGVARCSRITFLIVLRAVSSVSDLRLGRQVHARVVRSAALGCEASVGNSLITMYGRCGDVARARVVFDGLPVLDVISWNSMLAGYAQNEKLEECCELFREMQLLGIEPDGHTMAVLLRVLLPESSSCKLGREIHGYLLRRAVPGVSIYNAMVMMYAKSKRLPDAEKIFEGMGERDSYSWNAMMDAYSMNGCYDDALKLFVHLLEQGLQFDHQTLSILLAACGRLALIEQGKQFHAFALKHQLRLCDSKTSVLSINNVLVSMYSKCGSIRDATHVFRRMEHKDVFSWTAMITGCAHQGMARESIRLFHRMRRDGTKPNSITFLGLLTACAHAGLIEEGDHYFSLMGKENNTKRGLEHYACMVDLFGRSGQFERAEAMVAAGISDLGQKHGVCLALWKVLLGACHAHRELELGKRAAVKILELEPEDESTHVLVSNLYASFGLWREAIDVRRKMRDKGLKKEAGCSWVEIANRRHVFFSGDVRHSNQEDVYEKLGELDERCRALGYVPMTELVLHNVDEVQKEVILSRHSEKLAVSFAVLKTGSARSVIRVIKNLRVCGDCHEWMKFASAVEGRDIVLRDSTRFHSFRDGECSCGDYW